MPRKIHRFIADENGSVYILFLGLTLVVISMIALMIEAGRVYVEHTRLQHFIDRVAAAASLELDGEADAIERARTVINSEALASKALYSQGNSGDYEIDQIYFMTGAPPLDNNDPSSFEELVTADSLVATHIFLTAKPRQMNWIFPSAVSGFNNSLTLTASAVAAASLERDQDIEFTFAIDNSPSMLFAATQEEYDILRETLNCEFACHYSKGNNSKTSYEIAKEAGIRFRLDSALNAVKLAANYVKDNPIQGGAKIFFDINVFARKMEDVPYGENQADLLNFNFIGDLEPVSKPSNDVYTMTDTKKSLRDLAKLIRKKLREAPDRDHVAVIMTDGVADYRDSGDNKRVIRTVNPANCQEFKDLGVEIAIIYTKYLPVPENSFWVENVDPIDENIPVDLAACASEGLFFEVTYADDIDAAFLRLMQRQYEVKGARLIR